MFSFSALFRNKGQVVAVFDTVFHQLQSFGKKKSHYIFSFDKITFNTFDFPCGCHFMLWDVLKVKKIVEHC